MLAFDHLVHLTQAPHETARNIRDTGIHTVTGGRHEMWGTYNALCYFDLSYIEFLGVENRKVATMPEQNPLVRQAVAHLPQREGFARIAIRTERIRQLADELRANGLSVVGPLPGSRTRADGTVIRWSLLFPEGSTSELMLPFFIQWEQSDEERRKDLVRSGMMANHPLGSLRLKHVAFTVRDLERRVADWTNWFGLQAGARFIDDDWQAECQQLKLPGGNLLFCSPFAEGAIADVLSTSGETPFCVDIAGSERNSEQQITGALYRLLTE